MRRESAGGALRIGLGYNACVAPSNSFEGVEESRAGHTQEAIGAMCEEFLAIGAEITAQQMQ